MEHGPQQAALGAERGGQHRVGFPGIGLHQLAQDLDRGVEFRERGLKQRLRVSAGHRRGLAEVLAPPRQLGNIGVQAIRPAVLRHVS